MEKRRRIYSQIQRQRSTWRILEAFARSIEPNQIQKVHCVSKQHAHRGIKWALLLKITRWYFEHYLIQVMLVPRVNWKSPLRTGDDWVPRRALKAIWLTTRTHTHKFLFFFFFVSVFFLLAIGVWVTFFLLLLASGKDRVHSCGSERKRRKRRAHTKQGERARARANELTLWSLGQRKRFSLWVSSSLVSHKRAKKNRNKRILRLQAPLAEVSVRTTFSAVNWFLALIFLSAETKRFFSSLLHLDVHLYCVSILYFDCNQSSLT